MSDNQFQFVYFTHREMVVLVKHPRGGRLSDQTVTSLLKDKLDDNAPYNRLYNESKEIRDFLYENGINAAEINEGGVIFGLDSDQTQVCSFALRQDDHSPLTATRDADFSLVLFPVGYVNSELKDALGRHGMNTEDLSQLGHDIPPDVVEPLRKDDMYLLYLTGELHRSFIRDPQAEDDDENSLVLCAVTPDWLFGGTPSQVSTGGPGSKPMPPAGSPGQGGVDPAQWAFAVTDKDLITPRTNDPKYENYKKFRDKFISAAGPNMVEVVIFDTVPSQASLKRAWHDLGSKNKLFNQFFKGPTNPQDTFEIFYYDDKNDPAFKKTFKLKKHDYDMSDHGLFIAGIIRTLAPEAHIKLIQVLNDYGVGSLKALCWGADKLNEKMAGQSAAAVTVINSSLMISFPFDESQIDPSEKSVVDRFYELLHKIFGENFKTALVLGVQALYDSLRQDQTMMFAAAGNDGKGGEEEQVEARYPAAFEGVFGVGAWRGDFSNKADMQSDEGFLAYGGDPNNLVTDGILGLYTCAHYPDSVAQNDLGLARWAGTSFATAIATGTFARLIGRGCGGNEAMALMKLAVQEDEEVSHTPPVEGDILPVKQGL